MKIDHPLFKALAGPLARVYLAFRRVRPYPEAGSLRILNFHETPRESFPQFSQLMSRLLEEHGIIRPQDAEIFMEGRGGAFRSQRRAPCVVSFDDGYKSNYSLAKEVLEPLGIRGIFFVCPGLVDLEPALQRKAIVGNIRENLSLLDNVGFERELMTWKDIQELAAAGHVIGSHGLSHRRLSTTTPEDLKFEVGEAAKLLEARLGQPSRWFAYPFGSISSINSAALACVGEHHRFCRSGVRGLNVPGTPALGLVSEVLDLSAPLDYQLAAAEGLMDFRYRAARRKLTAMLSFRDSRQ